MDVRIEIAGDRVILKQDEQEALSVPLTTFLASLVERSDTAPFPDAIPEGVVFVRRRGDFVALVIEEKPKARTVSWLTDDSPKHFGPDARYRKVRLAFPFVVLVIVFRGGNLTGLQQCFYRREPLTSLDNPLCFPNLYNVANGHGQLCWLCLANLRQDLSGLTWAERVRTIQQHLWGGGWNRSSEVHEGMSYWGAMRPDRRLDTLESWEQESRRDPYFAVNVDWKPVGKTVGQVVDEMLAALTTARPPNSFRDLVRVLAQAANGDRGKDRMLALKLMAGAG